MEKISKVCMEQNTWKEIERLYQEFTRLGINQSVDYEKYYLYSLITHSTAIEGSTLTETDTQLLFDEGVTAKEIACFRNRKISCFRT